ncbi:MAG: S8 family serine peptidase [Gemmatimonadaceae bacterium]|nr:S8 family serine peptidase [Gemmatimonadaceae bacterium]
MRIALVDSGVDFSHPDLVHCCDRSQAKCYLRVLTEVDDQNGHGTHLAGIIAGNGHSDVGFRGIAPKAQILVLRVQGKAKGFLEMDVAEAVSDAVEMGVDIINLSLGRVSSAGLPPWAWPSRNNALEDAIVEAESRGVLCVVAAGNSGDLPGSITAPGGIEAALTVGNVCHQLKCGKASSRGPFRRHPSVPSVDGLRFDAMLMTTTTGLVVSRKPDISCFGEAIGSLNARLPDNENHDAHTQMSGTSQAAAAVTGLAALALSELRRSDVNTGPNCARTLRGIFAVAARLPDGGRREALGRGVVRWPDLQGVVGRAVNDANYAATVHRFADPLIVHPSASTP